MSYDVLLPNGKLTSRHRRFMTRDIPENVETQLGDDEGIHGAPENEGSVTSGHSREGAGVVTRSRSRFIGKLARSTSGKFPGGDDLVSESRGADLVTEREIESQVTLHSSGGTTEEMGSKSCVSLPLLCLGVWAILSSLVIACLSYFLHGCTGRSLSSMSSSQPADCIQTGPQISETNLDFLNVDISEKDIVDTARQVKCDCTWEVIEWSLFEVIVVALLLLIFGYLSMTDGVSHFLKYLKKRNSDENRLQRELDSAISKQNKLMKKMGKSGAESTAQVQAQPTGDAAQPFSAL